MYLGPQNDTQGALDMGLHARLSCPAMDRWPMPRRVRRTRKRGAIRSMAEAGLSAPEILKAAAEGKIKALWIVSDNWLRSAPDRASVEQAMANAELVIVNELFLTETARRAHVVFPASAFAEKEGVVVNCERRVQKTVRALAWRKGCRPDWEIFQSVAQSLGARWSYRSAEEIFREIGRLVPGLPRHELADAACRSVRSGRAKALPPSQGAVAASPSHNGAAPADGLWLLSGGILFLQGTLSHHGELLPRLAGAARATLHPDEAARLQLTEGDEIDLRGPNGPIRLPVVLDPAVPVGSVFVPYAFPGIELNRLGAASGHGLRVTVSRAGHPEPVNA
jgi:predicted molibdopterin-dependent oxidoreductase YjgC